SCTRRSGPPRRAGSSSSSTRATPSPSSARSPTSRPPCCSPARSPPTPRRTPTPPLLTSQCRSAYPRPLSWIAPRRSPTRPRPPPDLTPVLRRSRPDVVVCGDPTARWYGNEYLNHPDHRAVASAVLDAVFPSAETRAVFPELLTEGLEPHHVKEVLLTGAVPP